MLLQKEETAVLKNTVRSIGRSACLLAGVLALGLFIGACSQSETPEKKESGKDKQAAVSSKPRLYEASRVNCSMFTADDAAAILGVPVEQIQRDSQELYAGNWQCTYEGGSSDKVVNFNISLEESVEDAISSMDQYRGHLEIARGTEPFKDDLAKGAYSDISGIGDDALWTAVNKTLTVRKGNISIQVQLPNEKETQIKVAEKVLARLE